MRRSLTYRLGIASDRLFGLFVPHVEAGACVIEHSRVCRCVSDGSCPCMIGHPRYEYREYRYDCYGNCNKTGTCGC
jgi:hypothetical protein